MDQWWNNTDSGEMGYTEVYLTQCHFSPPQTRQCSGIELGLLRRTPGILQTVGSCRTLNSLATFREAERALAVVWENAVCCKKHTKHLV